MFPNNKIQFVNGNTNFLSISSSDAKSIGEELIRAAEETEDHGYTHVIDVYQAMDTTRIMMGFQILTNKLAECRDDQLGFTSDSVIARRSDSRAQAYINNLKKWQDSNNDAFLYEWGNDLNYNSTTEEIHELWKKIVKEELERVSGGGSKEDDN